MADIWLTSDTHFGHKNIITFMNQYDQPLRPFSSVEEMDEAMVENWNKTVKQGDKVYHLGDVTMNKKNLPILSRLNGKKRLVRGNHDDMIHTKEFSKYFEHIYGVRVFKGDFICSHIPIHKDSMARYKCNVHGHTHSRFLNDPEYLSVCVEQTKFTPIHYDEVLSRIQRNIKSFEDTGSVIDWNLE